MASQACGSTVAYSEDTEEARVDKGRRSEGGMPRDEVREVNRGQDP